MPWPSLENSIGDSHNIKSVLLALGTLPVPVSGALVPESILTWEERERLGVAEGENWVSAPHPSSDRQDKAAWKK